MLKIQWSWEQIVAAIHFNGTTLRELIRSGETITASKNRIRYWGDLPERIHKILNEAVETAIQNGFDPNLKNKGRSKRTRK